MQKYNQNNLATLQIFSAQTKLRRFFGHDLGFKLIFRFGPGSGLYFRVRAGFGLELVGPFTALVCSICCLVAIFFDQEHFNFCFKPHPSPLQNHGCAHGCSCEVLFDPVGNG